VRKKRIKRWKEDGSTERSARIGSLCRQIRLTCKEYDENSLDLVYFQLRSTIFRRLVGCRICLERIKWEQIKVINLGWEQEANGAARSQKLMRTVGLSYLVNCLCIYVSISFTSKLLLFFLIDIGITWCLYLVNYYLVKYFFKEYPVKYYYMNCKYLT